MLYHADMNKALNGWQLLAVLLVFVAFVGAYLYVTSTPTLAASPSSGNAPLQVTFTFNPPGSIDGNGGEYSIDFGDGVRDQSLYLTGGSSSVGHTNHTYQNSGTYTVSLWANSLSKPANLIKTITVVVH